MLGYTDQVRDMLTANPALGVAAVLAFLLARPPLR